MEDAGNEGLKNNERVVPESEVKKLKAKISELERALGRKTLDNEILTEALKIAREKNCCREGAPGAREVGNEAHR